MASGSLWSLTSFCAASDEPQSTTLADASMQSPTLAVSESLPPQAPIPSDQADRERHDGDAASNPSHSVTLLARPRLRGRA